MSDGTFIIDNEETTYTDEGDIPEDDGSTDKPSIEEETIPPVEEEISPPKDESVPEETLPDENLDNGETEDGEDGAPEKPTVPDTEPPIEGETGDGEEDIESLPDTPIEGDIPIIEDDVDSSIPVDEEDEIEKEEDFGEINPTVPIYIDREVMHWTHDSLDGTAAALISQYIFTNVDVEICNQRDIDMNITYFLTKYLNEDGSLKFKCPYDLLIISSLFVNQINIEWLEQFREKTGIEILMFDHNVGSNENHHPWATVQFEDRDGNKLTGSYLYFNHCRDSYPQLFEKIGTSVEAFIENVRLFTTWEWHEQDLSKPSQLNDLLNAIGHEKFMNRFLQNLDVNLSDRETAIVNNELSRIERYIKLKEDQMFLTELAGYRVAVTYAEEHQPLLGDNICRNHPEIDFVIVINMGRGEIILRTLKANIHLGDFASFYNGGSGFDQIADLAFDNNIKYKIFRAIFNRR